MSLTRLLLPVALQQVVGLNVEDIAERVGEAHVKAVDMPVRCHEAERRAPGNLVPPHQRGELVGVGRGGALPAHQFGDAHSHFQHVTNTTLSVTGVKSGIRAHTVSGDTIDTKRIALHIGTTSTERRMRKSIRWSREEGCFQVIVDGAVIYRTIDRSDAREYLNCV